MEQPVTPLIHNWFMPAVESWTRFMYGGRHRVWFAFGILFVIAIVAIAAKAAIFWLGVCVIVALALITSIVDIATYFLRLRWDDRAWEAASR